MTSWANYPIPRALRFACIEVNPWVSLVAIYLNAVHTGQIQILCNSNGVDEFLNA